MLCKRARKTGETRVWWFYGLLMGAGKIWTLNSGLVCRFGFFPIEYAFAKFYNL